MDYQGAKTYMLKRLKNELPEIRTYHCFDHTIDVYSAVIGIAENEGVAEDDLKLLKLASIYHDCGFLIQGADHEEVGCGITRKKLQEFDYSNGSIDKVCGMIMATKIPQSPKTHLEMIICDADLDYLGRGDFFQIGDTLFEELKSGGVVDSFDQWNELQVKFLEAHSYWTKTCQKMRDEKKAENLEKVKGLLKNKKAPS